MSKTVRVVTCLLLSIILAALRPAVAHADAPGQLDTTFGAGGKATTDFFGADDRAVAVELQPDGKVLVAGVARNSSTEDDFALARYRTHGTLDMEFGSGGRVTTDFFGSIARQLGASLTDVALKVLLQPDGKIIATGWAFEKATGFHYALVRYLPDGALDTSFGNGGKSVSNFPGKFEGSLAAALQADGKIVLAGTAGETVGVGLPSKIDFGVTRFNADGSLDSAFGDQGFVRTDFFGNIDEARALVIQPDGKIVVVGFANHPTSKKYSAFAMARYAPDGRLDATFGDSGKVITEFFAADDIAWGVALQPDGKIVVVGQTFNTTTGNIDMAFARYKGDGSLDATFGSGGLLTTDFAGGFDRARGVAVQAEGKILVNGFASLPGTGRDFALARYNADGSLDATFAAGGKTTTDFFGLDDVANGLAVQPDGKIVSVGAAASPLSGADFAVARYTGAA